MFSVFTLIAFNFTFKKPTLNRDDLLSAKHLVVMFFNHICPEIPNFFSFNSLSAGYGVYST